MPTKPENPYAKVYANFLEQTEGHQLTILNNESLYRHLRMHNPAQGSIWSWSVVTWPGYLATVGDIADGYTFTRELDMIEFFSFAGRSAGYYSDGSPSIDFRYWAEKLSGGRAFEVKKYSADVFLQLVREHLEESEELGLEAQDEYERQIALAAHLAELRGDTEPVQNTLESYWEAITWEKTVGSTNGNARTAAAAARAALWSTENLTDEQHDLLAAHPDWHELGDTDISVQSPAQRRKKILDDARWHSESEHDAHEWLRDNEQFVGSDTWEWDVRDYDVHFLFACYAIDLSVARFREHQAEMDALDHAHAA